MFSQMNELESRLQKQFLSRLVLKVKKLRKDLIERNWSQIRQECKHIRVGAESFGFEELKIKTNLCLDYIPDGEISRALNLPKAKACTEELINHIDTLLIQHEISR